MGRSSVTVPAQRAGPPRPQGPMGAVPSLMAGAGHRKPSTLPTKSKVFGWRAGRTEPAGTRDCSFQECLIRMAAGWFYLSALALSALGLMCVLFTVYWMQSWHGGFAWDGTIFTFNCHPVLMVAGMVVLYGAGEYEVSMGDALRPGPGRGRAVSLRGWFLSPLGAGLWRLGGWVCVWA